MTTSTCRFCLAVVEDDCGLLAVEHPSAELHSTERCRDRLVAQRSSVALFKSMNFDELAMLVDGLHGKIASLQAYLADASRERDEWKQLAEVSDDNAREDPR